MGMKDGYGKGYGMDKGFGKGIGDKGFGKGGFGKGFGKFGGGKFGKGGKYNYNYRGNSQDPEVEHIDDGITAEGYQAPTAEAQERATQIQSWLDKLKGDKWTTEGPERNGQNTTKRIIVDGKKWTIAWLQGTEKAERQQNRPLHKVFYVNATGEIA